MGAADGKVYVYKWVLSSLFNLPRNKSQTPQTCPGSANLVHDMKILVQHFTRFAIDFSAPLQHGREIRSYRHVDDAQQSHRLHRFQHGRPLRAINVPGQNMAKGIHTGH